MIRRARLFHSIQYVRPSLRDVQVPCWNTWKNFYDWLA